MLSGTEFSPSQSPQQPGAMTTGMRSCRGASKAFAVVVTMAKDLIVWPAGERHSSHNPEVFSVNDINGLHCQSAVTARIERKGLLGALSSRTPAGGCPC